MENTEENVVTILSTSLVSDLKVKKSFQTLTDEFLPPLFDDLAIEKMLLSFGTRQINQTLKSK